jgi:transglutaminase-like putative cysteine protease
VEWVYNNLQKRQVDVATALDALQGGAAECQGHAMLYTALARAAGIPTRVASGIAYVPSLGGFIYHAWAESMIDGQWVPVDPSFGQTPADALRLKLSEGEGPEHYGPILNWIGKARVRILSISR